MAFQLTYLTERKAVSAGSLEGVLDLLGKEHPHFVASASLNGSYAIRENAASTTALAIVHKVPSIHDIRVAQQLWDQYGVPC